MKFQLSKVNFARPVKYFGKLRKIMNVEIGEQFLLLINTQKLLKGRKFYWVSRHYLNGH